MIVLKKLKMKSMKINENKMKLKNLKCPIFKDLLINLDIIQKE